MNNRLMAYDDTPAPAGTPFDRELKAAYARGYYNGRQDQHEEQRDAYASGVMHATMVVFALMLAAAVWRSL